MTPSPHAWTERHPNAAKERSARYTPPVTEVLRTASEAWLRQAVGGLGPLFMISALLFLVQRWAQHNWARVIGWRGVTYSTGWIGTPIHELSHLVVGRLFGVRITDFRLFSPDPNSGVLGYVNYRVPRWRLVELPQIVGTFLMGIAPLFGGAAALILLRYVLVDRADDAAFAAAIQTFRETLARGAPGAAVDPFFTLVTESFRPLWNNADDPRVWAYVYLSVAIGAHLAPSRADLKGGLRGFLVLAFLGFVANVVAVTQGIEPASATATIADWTAPMATLLAFALALNVGYGAIGFALALLRR